jgi:hypothetical protein
VCGGVGGWCPPPTQKISKTKKEKLGGDQGENEVP